MKIADYRNSPKKENPHSVDVTLLYDKAEAQVVMISLNPGQSLKPHITPVDVFFFVVEGKATILVGDEKQVVDEKCLVESPKDIIHCIYNESDSILRVLVAKTPKPTA
jgi:quercetin dioxygenase-like cupin family protein